jgi:integrin beta 3
MNVQDAIEAGFSAVKGYVDRSLIKIVERIAKLEAIKPEKGEPGEKGNDGRDGIDGKNGERGERGEKGEQGPPGRDGRDGLQGLPGEKGKDGVNGKDGRDGFGLEDFSIETADDGRSFTLLFARGDEKIIRNIKTGIVLDRGVWKEATFEKGDCVTWGGSLWIAQRDTSNKPDTADSGWRLAVKRGRDGKDAGK